jgi:SAM-dependent methyltransferase
MAFIDLDVPATEEAFDERGYLAANPDVAAAVAAGHFASGLHHFRSHGRRERRRQRRGADLAPLRARKLERLRPLLRTDLPHVWRGDKPDYLTEELRRETGIVDTSNVSANGYDGETVELFESCAEGLVLDCGAGRRDRYWDHVVNLEIVDYDSTDVLAVGEVLPFRDASFDAVISIAVLEHVRDPFRCAAELVRVLKPGGRLLAAVPLLQPLHGYPHHYYNMTHQGLRALFERSLRIDRQVVPDSTLPVWALAWIVRSWADGLPPAARERFLGTRLGTFAGGAEALLDEPFVRELPPEKNLELACGTVLFATKPAQP